MRRRGKEELVVDVYVDDLIINGARVEDIDSFKHEMVACFRMSDLGALSYYLGIEVRQGKETLTLDQSTYASKLLKRSGMAECKPCVTLMEEWLKLTKSSTTARVDEILYRSIVGGLRYLVHMRPDIAFTVGYISRFMEDLREDHWAAVKRLLRYIKKTVDQGIVFPKTGRNGLQLTMFSDADMAGDIDGRDYVDGGQIVIEFVETSRQLVDILTKPVLILNLQDPTLDQYLASTLVQLSDADDA
ncbi:uncharacterized mitochondrial protein AtMg00810-like [Miscanthus floridulus]|uniref:uncharacterized mitochondrial protein AtMg00810-like n=1 Tax=Miscanthus floridulus TaxID=154761 RepID=UPI00345A7339